MAYQLEEITLEKAYAQAEEYEYALLYRISDRILCKAQDLPENVWEECIEARIFSDSKELHIFEGEDRMKAVVLTELDKEDVIIKDYTLENAFRHIGEFVRVCQYLGYDEDGQAYVSMTRLKGIQ